MKIFTIPTFDRAVKKLHKNAKNDLDSALRELIRNPSEGALKKGDLRAIRVYKFRMVGQLTLLAYIYDEDAPSVTLIAIGSHENFYRDLKRES